MKPIWLLLAVTLAISLPQQLWAVPLEIVAAENFYGGVAKQIAGPSAEVTSILTNPNQDPHEFTSNARTARAIADADVVIYSGIDYDFWIERLLGNQGKPGRVVINVSTLIGAKSGDNPHIWYSPKTMPALADKLVQVLSALDPNGSGAFTDRSAKFKSSMEPELKKIAEIRAQADGCAVTATEPVYGYMADALGFRMLNYGFQVNVMNDAEPSASQTAAFEQSLRSHAAKILFYNSQVTDPTTSRIQEIAHAADVPVVGVTETQPPDQPDYAGWMLHQLAGVQAALPKKNG